MKKIGFMFLAIGFLHLGFVWGVNLDNGPVFKTLLSLTPIGYTWLLAFVLGAVLIKLDAMWQEERRQEEKLKR